MGKKESHDTGPRLRQIANRLYDGNMSDLARALEMKPPSFSKYVHGRRHPGAKVLKRLIQLGINLHWFLTGEGSMMRVSSDQDLALPLMSENGESAVDSPDGPLHRIPLLHVASDGGTPVLKEMGGAEWLAASFIKNEYGVSPHRLKGFRVSGGAMQGTIRPGDRVRGVLWKEEALTEGAIYLLCTDAGVLVRRVLFEENTVTLSAEDPEVPDLSVEAGRLKEAFSPVARIVEVTRSL